MQISNNSTLGVQRAGSDAKAASDTQMQRLASGSRINSAKDDAAGLAISTKLDSNVSSTSVAIRNTMDGISRTQVEDGALSATTDDLQRIRELKLQQNNGLLAQADKDALQSEINQRMSAIEERFEQTEFNGQKVFSGEDLNFQTGSEAGDITTIEGEDLASAFSQIGLKAGEEVSLDQLDEALASVSERRADLGAVANRFESQVQFSELKNEMTAQASSRIKDTDFAQATSEKAKADIQNQASISIQAQANLNQKNVLQLLK